MRASTLFLFFSGGLALMAAFMLWVWPYYSFQHIIVVSYWLLALLTLAIYAYCRWDGE